MTAADAAAWLGGRRVLGQITTEAGFDAAIVRGLPAGALNAVLRRLASSTDGAVLLRRVVGVAAPTRSRRASAPPLSRSQSERLARVAQCLARAQETLGTRERAARWISSPNRSLGEIPLLLLEQEHGIDRVLEELGRIDHGIVS